MKKATYEAGIHGEEIAKAYLSERGMQCIATRHREKPGEIDLIMEDGETVVFVEVKARFSEKQQGLGLCAVTPSKQKRIARSAVLFLAKKGWLKRDVRFDVVEINQDEIIHIRNAFQPGGMMF